MPATTTEAAQHRTAGHARCLLLSLGLGALAASASAETVNCTAITSAPYTVSSSGVYCLTGDLSTNLGSGSAIDIQANNVLLDLNGHKIGNLSAGLGTMANGIAAYQRQNITIRNGTVRGFLYGISLTDASPFTASQGHIVEDIRADQNTYAGIRVEGTGSIVRRNHITATGGSTIFGNMAQAIAIVVTGYAVRILDNDIITVTDQGNVGSFGIAFSGGGGNHLAVRNRITQAKTGIEFCCGMAVNGKYRDNLTTGANIPFSGGTDAGHNN